MRRPRYALFLLLTFLSCLSISLAACKCPPVPVLSPQTHRLTIHSADILLQMHLFRQQHNRSPRRTQRGQEACCRLQAPRLQEDVQRLQPSVLPRIQLLHRREGGERADHVLPARLGQGPGRRLHLHRGDGGAAGLGWAAAVDRGVERGTSSSDTYAEAGLTRCSARENGAVTYPWQDRAISRRQHALDIETWIRYAA